MYKVELYSQTKYRAVLLWPIFDISDYKNYYSADFPGRFYITTDTDIPRLFYAYLCKSTRKFITMTASNSFRVNNLFNVCCYVYELSLANKNRHRLSCSAAMFYILLALLFLCVVSVVSQVLCTAARSPDIRASSLRDPTQISRLLFK